jgi:hypothetical protein
VCFQWLRKLKIVGVGSARLILPDRPVKPTPTRMSDAPPPPDPSDAPPALPPRESILFGSAAQRRGAVVLLSIGCAFLLVLLLRDRAYVPNPAPDSGGRSAELVDKIDPNTAPARILSALPLLGPSRANDIVDFRNRSTTQPAFKTASDLLQIRGIGPGILRQIEPYLQFDPPASQIAR